jgi:N-acetylmuramic acid 6-phosphate etherase
MRPLDNLISELQRAGRADLDRLPTAELVALMHDDDGAVHAAVGAALPAITATVDAIAGRLAAGGRLVYVGAGTSGRLGILDASECGPTFNAPDGQIAGVIAGGLAAITQAVEGAEDDGPAGARDLADLGVGPLDAVVGISASGRTPYVLEAIRHAARGGAVTAGLVCNPGAALSELVDHPIEVVVGPEFISGSTRLKAGTAQKLVLNMLSTLAMVRLRKTYGSLMVDMRITNDKLSDRAQRIVAQAAGVERTAAKAALRAADDEVKVAITMLVSGTGPDEARDRLRRAGGDLRRALEENACA